MGYVWPHHEFFTAYLEEVRKVLGKYWEPKVIAKDGWLFASVYNHAALAYERWKDCQDDSQQPISTWIDRELGKIIIRTPFGIRTIDARTYTPGQFTRELRQTGFHIGGYLTFPVLYSTLECSEIENLAEVEKETKICWPK